jgi:hypothetical protein
MARFNPSGFAENLDKDDKAAHEKVKGMYANALERLSGMNEEELQQFSASSEDLSAVMAEINAAIAQNHSQAQLIANIKTLGSGAMRLAKQVKGLV